MKQWWIVKGKHAGDWSNDKPFYSCVLSAEELKELIDFYQENYVYRLEGRFTRVVEYAEYEKLEKRIEELKNQGVQDSLLGVELRRKIEQLQIAIKNVRLYLGEEKWQMLFGNWNIP